MKYTPNTFADTSQGAGCGPGDTILLNAMSFILCFQGHVPMCCLTSCNHPRDFFSAFTVLRLAYGSRIFSQLDPIDEPDKQPYTIP